MKKIFFLLSFFSTLAFAQTEFKHYKSFEIKSSFCTADNQGNFYIINGNEVSKYDKTGKILYKYSNKNLGDIDFIDVSNQLKILLFYKNFSQAIFLDNTLSMSGTPVSFDQLGFQQAQLVCTSHNNSIWIYDQQTFSIVRVNSNYEEIQRTANLNNVLNINLQPNYILEYDNKVYLNNPQTGILIFDIYGTYYKTIPIKDLTSFQPIGDFIYYKQKNTIKTYNIKTIEEKEYKLPINEFDTFSLQIGTLFLQSENKISIFYEE